MRNLLTQTPVVGRLLRSNYLWPERTARRRVAMSYVRGGNLEQSSDLGSDFFINRPVSYFCALIEPRANSSLVLYELTAPG